MERDWIRGKQAGDVLATADFRLTGTGYGGRKVNNTIHAALQVSGAYQYGNQTCMTFEWDNGYVESFDTRYEKVTPKTFKEFAKSVIENQVVDTVQVELAG